MPAPHEKLILLLFDLDRPADAEKAIREGLASEPNDAMLHCLLSHALRKQRKIRAAVEAAKDAIGLLPGNGYAHATLGWALLNTRTLKGAATAFEEGCRLEPQNADYLHGWAEALRCTGKRRRAKEIAERGVAVDPSHTRCICTIGCCLGEWDRLDEALVQFERARSIAPLDPYPHAMLGWIHLKKVRPDRAAWHYLEAVRLKPDDKENQHELRNSVNKISHFIAWPAYAVFAAIVIALAATFAERVQSNVVDSIAGVSILMLLPLAVLLGRNRFRETLALLPFRLGRTLQTASDRRYVFHVLCAYLLTGLLTVVVGLTAPPAKPNDISELLRYLACCAFPLAPIAIGLDRRRMPRSVVISGAVLCSILQIALIAGVYFVADMKETKGLQINSILISIWLGHWYLCGNLTDE